MTMFKQSRRKIVAAILSALVLLLCGTFCTIYLASYAEMTGENQRLLQQYVDAYSIPGTPDGAGMDRGDPRRPPRAELSTFYSVAISKEGEVLKADTADISTLSEEALTELAREIIAGGKTDGVKNSLLYRMADKGSYTLVAFLDNTLMLENAGTLIDYTLIFGGAALVLLFFLARFLAGRIVAPLEESYRLQKQFISDAGHELKTPVAVVSANLELLSREIGENRWLSNIQYENERMSALIIQLLELARAENTVPQTEPLDMSRLVCGGTISITASGDGIDSNGSLTISGGEITVTGPAQGDTSVLDYDTTAVITGGVFLGTGGAGMAQTFSSAGQGVISLNAGSQPAGTAVTLTDSAGSTILICTPELPFSFVICSSPDIVSGETYTLVIGTESMEVTAD